MGELKSPTGDKVIRWMHVPIPRTVALCIPSLPDQPPTPPLLDKRPPG